MVIVGAFLLWERLADIRAAWDGAERFNSAWPGFYLASLIYIAATWLDIVFVQMAALLCVNVLAVGCLGGRRALRMVVPIVGFLAFAIPFPTTLTAAIAFPLQLLSCRFAADLAAVAGMNVVRHGVDIAAYAQGASASHFYSVTVAAPCSGLTSTGVLLATGYLIAYWTPGPLLSRALLVISVIPVALAANAIRIAFVLAAGVYISPSVASWVHGHEAPVLVVISTLGLVLVRSLLSKLYRGSTPCCASRCRLTAGSGA